MFAPRPSSGPSVVAVVSACVAGFRRGNERRRAQPAPGGRAARNQGKGRTGRRPTRTARCSVAPNSAAHAAPNGGGAGGGQAARPRGLAERKPASRTTYRSGGPGCWRGPRSRCHAKIGRSGAQKRRSTRPDGGGDGHFSTSSTGSADPHPTLEQVPRAATEQINQSFLRGRRPAAPGEGTHQGSWTEKEVRGPGGAARHSPRWGGRFHAATAAEQTAAPARRRSKTRLARGADAGTGAKGARGSSSSSSRQPPGVGKEPSRGDAWGATLERETAYLLDLARKLLGKDSLQRGEVRAALVQGGSRARGQLRVGERLSDQGRACGRTSPG